MIPPGLEGDETVSSPCIRVCQLDPGTDLCTGCFRTRAEVASWLATSADERRRVLARVAERRAAK